MTNTRLESVRHFVDHYIAELESWQVEHDDAMRSYALADRASFLVFLIGRIEKLDESIRESYLVKNGAYDDEAEKFESRLYTEWYWEAKRCLIDSEALEKQGGLVEGLAEFRQNVREVAGILTVDADFFAGSDLDNLRDAAVDAHRNGETEPLENCD
jgi:hypothetical protein